jgi:micrococcal nuclease
MVRRRRYRPRPQSTRLRWLRAARPWALLSLLLAMWPTLDGALFEPPVILMGDREVVQGQFSRCGLGRKRLCVIDGDTFKIDERNIRIVGIDAPEVHEPNCPAEAAMGEAATAELQRQLNIAPFAMRSRIDDPVDGYGRELMVLSRTDDDGAEQSLAATLLASGKVQRYLGGLRGGWC